MYCSGGIIRVSNTNLNKIRFYFLTEFHVTVDGIVAVCLVTVEHVWRVETKENVIILYKECLRLLTDAVQ